jgi:hypothetical protein
VGAVRWTAGLFGILAVGVLLITYVPWLLTLGILHWMGRV